MTNIINIRSSADSVFGLSSSITAIYNTYVVYSKTTTDFAFHKGDRLELFQGMSRHYYNFAEVTNSGVLIFQKLLAEKYRDKKPVEEVASTGTIEPISDFLDYEFPILSTISKYNMESTRKC